MLKERCRYRWPIAAKLNCRKKNHLFGSALPVFHPWSLMWSPKRIDIAPPSSGAIIQIRGNSLLQREQCAPTFAPAIAQLALSDNDNQDPKSALNVVVEDALERNVIRIFRSIHVNPACANSRLVDTCLLASPHDRMAAEYVNVADWLNVWQGWQRLL